MNYSILEHQINLNPYLIGGSISILLLPVLLYITAELYPGSKKTKHKGLMLYLLINFAWISFLFYHYNNQQNILGRYKSYYLSANCKQFEGVITSYEPVHYGVKSWEYFILDNQYKFAYPSRSYGYFGYNITKGRGSRFEVGTKISFYSYGNTILSLKVIE
jgi:hypothetical protein